ncbi:MAG: hypothetical protein K6G83_10495 [Lachnospiraceae bacterium]|nr:hypothetical protein [Lachnospiraceae bacterium]
MLNLIEKHTKDYETEKETKMICEVIRGLTFAASIAEKAEKCAKKTGFGCDEMPFFKDRDDEEEGRGCDKVPCCRNRDDGDEEDDDDDEEDEVIDVKAEVVKEEKKDEKKDDKNS